MKRAFNFDTNEITVKFGKSRKRIVQRRQEDIAADQQLSDDDEWEDISEYGGDEEVPDNEEMVKHFELLAKILHNYKSGPVPKTLKMLPNLVNFEFYLTKLDADQWSPSGLRVVTKCFATKGGVQAGFFYENYLLPRVRDEIADHKRISWHIERALDAAKYRQMEFIEHFLMPWLQSDDYSNAELNVLAYYIKKKSFTDANSKGLVAYLLTTEFNVLRLFIVGLMMEKREVMTSMTLKMFIDYYLKFDSDEAKMYYTDSKTLPLTFYQVLSDFLNRYGNHLKFSDVLNLQKVLRRHPHHHFTKELQNKLLSLQSSALMDTGASSSSA